MNSSVLSSADLVNMKRPMVPVKASGGRWAAGYADILSLTSTPRGKLAVSNFWNKLTPEAREEFIRKRTAKSQAAKAAKRAAREQTALS